MAVVIVFCFLIAMKTVLREQSVVFSTATFRKMTEDMLHEQCNWTQQDWWSKLIVPSPLVRFICDATSASCLEEIITTSACWWAFPRRITTTNAWGGLDCGSPSSPHKIEVVVARGSQPSISSHGAVRERAAAPGQTPSQNQSSLVERSWTC